jgi:hypothetical protein
MSSEEDRKRNDLIYKIIVDRYDLEWKRTNDLDTKASNVTGIAGILTALMAGISGFFQQAHYKWLFLIPLAFLIFSAISGLWAYWISSFDAINPNVLIEEYKETAETKILEDVSATMSKHTMHNFLVNQRKVRRIYGAFIFLVLAIGLFFAFAIMNSVM